MIDIMNLDNRELAKFIQFTITNPIATPKEVIKHAEWCIQYGFNASMVPMCCVPFVKKILKGTEVKVVTFFGLGLGYDSMFDKLELIRECVVLIADEVNFGPNMSFFLSGMYDEFVNEAILLKDATESISIRPMLEFWMLNIHAEKIKITKLIDEAGFP